MLKTLAVANYRSINTLVIALGRLNLITGPNGSGKSNLYRALRLLAETAQGGVVNALAREGGLDSTFWAGPQTLSRRMRKGEVAIEASVSQGPKRLRLGFAGEDFSYAIALGLPMPLPEEVSYFSLDPEIKRECIWAGAVYRPASLLVNRAGPMIKAREGRDWDVLAQRTPAFDSLFDQVGNLRASPEVLLLREQIRGWRFYDHFRSDAEAPARQVQLGTRTPVLHHDGRDLAAALQTIREIGDPQALQQAVSDAFPGARLNIVPLHGGRSVTVDFLGHPAAFPQGPWLLAGLLKCPVNLLMCLKHNSRYRLSIEPFADMIEWKRNTREQIIALWTARYAARLGQFCLEAPQQWFNFYPFWKTDDDAS